VQCSKTHQNLIKHGAAPNGKTLPLFPQTSKVLPAHNQFVAMLDLSSTQVKKSVRNVISASTTALAM